MVVSDAFETLTAVLQRVESSATDIEAVSVREQTTPGDEEITADLTVATPVLGDAHLDDDVSVKADGVDVRDRRLELDVTVTVPVDATLDSPSDGGESADDLAEAFSDSSTVPAYKDPEALRAAYETCDTFPEMTEALGADVTSETVRRYMVEYDIHDPSENAAPTGGLDLSDPQSNDSEPRADATEPSETEPATGSASDESDDLGERSVAALLAEDGEDSDDNLVADGLGVPQGLTVAELAATVNQSDSIHAVTRRLDLSQGHARRLLSELDLLDLVTHRLAAGQIRVSHAEIQRRITTETH
ncbi:hypothetical protein [Haloarcula salina]|uniref:Uncharacterized protein n=1 Tax=Haloarcula salina TaxID=1429914 RepID=A0AA41G3I5_9EURY|nr:hypothetical protein [Haloarcula salina]MBV0902789.1 hypothetical protein [Haloarcula salina]